MNKDEIIHDIDINYTTAKLYSQRPEVITSVEFRFRYKGEDLVINLTPKALDNFIRVYSEKDD